MIDLKERLNTIILQPFPQDPPFVDSYPNPDLPGHVIIDGFFGDVWRALQKATNFR